MKLTSAQKNVHRCTVFCAKAHGFCVKAHIFLCKRELRAPVKSATLVFSEEFNGASRDRVSGIGSQWSGVRSQISDVRSQRMVNSK